MRISVISAAVCCALFPLISVSAAGLSVEQRLAQLEARLNLAEQQASEASRRAQRAEQQTAAAEQRRGGGAAGAGAQPADHGSRTKTAGH
ncbi:carbohydrate porin [Klebsiella pneumoniae subsp. pneumoniae]|jgi:sucrose porin|uniref:Carbohydrate porin n=1 Tax=Klebsiella pneumoniae TaxID=573 RepID=A0A923J8V1_KLEPN|nr:carbohydrate porin [Klebsiella pneumoniae]MBD3704653.1 carbohydrate porin [Klebsiella pneumoniae]MBD3705815.1 carbohydrate porin [Klebsiella pneumoniae]MBD3718745.1 carbohydrate porin [Klebsiella pneumoniae]QCS96481.1 carbohydrate porin [Klebsiella pneumoniae subsp. pneumoniae]